MKLKEFLNSVKDLDYVSLIKFNSKDPIYYSVYNNDVLLNEKKSTKALIKFMDENPQYKEYYVFMIMKKEYTGNNLYSIYISDIFENHIYDL